MDSVLRMENIEKRFPGVVALKNMHLQLERGSIMALLGENGAGKSTLVKILSGAYMPDAGSIILDDEENSFMTPAKSIAGGISVIYQELNLVPQLTVYENIFLGKEILKNGFMDKKAMVEQSDKVLGLLGIKVESETLVKNLTVGFQQIIEVAKAIVQNAKILVLDEPTSSLSNAETDRLFKILRSLQKQGMSMIYISHRLEEVFEICDTVTVMRDGEFVGREKIEDVDRKKLISMMVGRTLSEVFPPKVIQESKETVLKVENLSGGLVDNVSFELHKGEILGISGLIGAGRTEMIRVLFGADSKTSGVIHINGKRVTVNRPIDAIRAGIGLVPEDRKRQGLNLNGSISDNISLANIEEIRGKLLLSGRKEAQLAKKYVEYLSIKTPSIRKKTMELSGGNQQKVVLAKWLAKHCKVLILDEPTRGIDVRSKYDIYRLIRELTEKGISIIMVSSEMPELLGMSDRIAVMHNNRIVDMLEYKEFSQERILNSASGGNS